jgi:5-methylcytosine-specific restriction endonuclease McrA
MSKTMCRKCHRRMTREGQSLCVRCQANHSRFDDAEYRRNAQQVYTAESHCWLCGLPVPREERSVDHVVKRRDGGSNRRENLRLAHLSCNSSRQ